MNSYFSVFVTLAALLSGCASTRMASQTNPEVPGRSFSEVLVLATFQNLEHRQLAEEKLCTELARIAGPGCLKSSEVFFPKEEYSTEAVSSRLSEFKIDAVLVLRPTESGVSSTYVPPTYFTTSSASVIGNMVTGSSTTQTSGGRYETSPWQNYEVLLLSIRDGKVVWYATAASKTAWFAEGVLDARWMDLINSASSKTVGQLVADGVFRKLEK